ncbi:MAG: DUF3105 domain-containing protein [Actinomycetota bacterium]|nr:DUF3105 domain-containing protein [Actinomycetota bacterium]
MAQRTPRGSASARGSASSRRASAQVKKPFPWGFVTGIVVLALALAGILVYAATNTGSGFRTAAERLDDEVQGVAVTSDPSADHVQGRVAYAVQPPNSGDHAPYPQTCQVYDAPVVPEHAVHSLEHGAAWVTYRPDLPADQVAALRALVEGNPHRMLSPFPGLSAPVTLQAWGRTLKVDSAADPRVRRFLDGYTNGPQTREKGASCQGVDQPGTEPFVLGPDGQSFVPSSATQPGSVQPGSVQPGSVQPGQVQPSASPGR